MIKQEPQPELPLVSDVVTHEVHPAVTKPSQSRSDAVFDPFNWTPVSWAIWELSNNSNYSLSGISPEDMNLRL